MILITDKFCCIIQSKREGLVCALKLKFIYPLSENTIHMAFHSLQPLRILFKSYERLQENKSERIYYYKRKMVS
jgi:hypothetical protein